MPRKAPSIVDKYLNLAETRGWRNKELPCFASLRLRHWTDACTRGVEVLRSSLGRLPRHALWCIPAVTARGSCLFLTDRRQLTIEVYDPANIITGDARGLAMQIVRLYHEVKRIPFLDGRWGFTPRPCGRCETTHPLLDYVLVGALEARITKGPSATPIDPMDMRDWIMESHLVKKGTTSDIAWGVSKRCSSPKRLASVVGKVIAAPPIAATDNGQTTFDEACRALDEVIQAGPSLSPASSIADLDSWTVLPDPISPLRSTPERSQPIAQGPEEEEVVVEVEPMEVVPPQEEACKTGAGNGAETVELKPVTHRGGRRHRAGGPRVRVRSPGGTRSWRKVETGRVTKNYRSPILQGK